jgi:hypothetical protein
MPTVIPAIYLTPDAVQVNTAKMMGRQSAGRGFNRGMAKAQAGDARLALFLDARLLVGKSPANV